MSEVPSLEQCVSAILRNPTHPRATTYAWALMLAMDRRVLLGTFSQEKRDEFYSLLGDVLFPPNE